MQGYDFYTDPDTGERWGVELSTGEVRKAVSIEVVAGTIYYTPEQQAAYRERQKKEKEHRLKQDMIKMQKDDLGHYYFALVLDYGLSPATLARLIFLCTFLRYDCDTLYLTQRTKMFVKDLYELLGLSRNTVSSFIKEASPYLYILDDDTIHINNDFFLRGALPKETHSSFLRIYIDTVRNLYRTTPINKHRYLGYVYLMLPYMNIEHNILCWNPEEKQLDSVLPLSVLDFCHIINYNDNQSARLCREYSKITFMVNGKLERFCSFVYDGSNPKMAAIYINPHIIYSGNDYKHVEILGAFCENA